jgi:Leucine-rich repeat (LRR) protein
MLKTKAEIQAWLDKMKIRNYTIDDDLTVDAKHVDLSYKELDEIPIQFGIVEEFHCSDNVLTSLKGAPKECRYFDCSFNKLVSLEFAPKEFISKKDRAFFLCMNNVLTSLKGAPKECKVFDCSNNKLTTLEFAPQKCTEFYCMNNMLTSLRGVPKECKYINCSENHGLKSLEGVPKECEVESDLDENNKISESLKPVRLSKFRL